MYREEKSLGLRLQKKMKKCVRRLTKTTSPIEEASLPKVDNLHGQNRAKPQKKRVVQQKARVAALMKHMVKKKQRRHSSKRTTPGQVDGKPGAPRNMHQEGARQLQQGEAQVLVRTRILHHSMNKQLDKKR